MDIPAWPIQVECYAGFKGNERPLALHHGGRRVAVREVADAWRGPDHAYFKLWGDDGRLYVVRHDLEDDTWQILQQDAPGSSGSRRTA